MSKFLKEPVYQGKALEDQWINSIHNNHDLFCGCEDVLTHLLGIYNRKGKAPKPKKDIKNIQCLITGEGKEDGDIIEDQFEPGELEKLFQGDGEFDENDQKDTDG